MKRGIMTLTALVFLASAPTFSQNPWSDHENRTAVSFEWDRPHFDSEFMGQIKTNHLTFVGYLNARLRLNDNVFILAEVPVSRYEWKYQSSNSKMYNTISALGQPFVGAEFRLTQNPERWHPFFNIGTYLPGDKKTMSGDELHACGCVLREYGRAVTSSLIHSNSLGAHPALLSDFDRGEAFWEDTWSVRANAGATRMFSGNNIMLRLSTGIIHNIYRGEWAELLNRETNLAYSIYVAEKIGSYKTHTVLYGRSPLGIRGLDFVGDTVMQIRAGVVKDFGLLALGGFFHTPVIDKYVKNLRFSYGLNLTMNF